MKKKEKLLFKSLCNYQSKKINPAFLEYASPAVLGHLFYNRMQAVAYGMLKENNFLGKVNREFRDSLRAAYEQNCEKNYSYYICIQYLKGVLHECHGKYAMLKGAVLCRTYPAGFRTSNDVDLLVLPEDITAVGQALTKAGFRQGYIRNMEFVPATRAEIVESKMLRGETVPYIKEVKMPYMKYLEVDINFSLDYKNSDSRALKEMMDKVIDKKVDGLDIPTLDDRDFFIHLCAHLYKEATTMPWIEMKRDMTLYKYCDLYVLLQKMTTSKITALFARAKELEMEKICSFAILQMAELFDLTSQTAVFMAEDCLRDDPEFLHTVYSPKHKKQFRYREKDVFKRFFADSREELLEEVKEPCKNCKCDPTEQTDC